MAGDSSCGTSHLKKHIDNCIARRHRSGGQQVLQLAKNALDDKVKVQTFKFDQERSRMDLARAIIKHNYPFNIVEHEYFEIFLNNLEPNFKLISRNTARADVISVYKEEKAKLYKYLDDFDGKISLTTDLWTSDHQNFAYACLTAHYVNEHWELKKKIIAFKSVPYPHDGETLFRFISDIILEWNIDKKLTSVVVDNASSNDSMVKCLKSWLLDKSLLNLGGDLFHVRCSAHILNLIVQDGLAIVGKLLHKIRETLKYLKRSTSSYQKFENAINQCKLKNKKRVGMDVQNRWNSTFLMLETALPLKEAFCRLEQMDRNYKLNPSENDWKVASVVHGCLKKFYEATCHFSGSNFPTANVFFPDICNLRLKMRQWEVSEHDFIREMAIPMKAKFEKYWEECSLVLAIAVVLDPRFKLALVEYYYNELYGEGGERYVDRVRNAIADLFVEYGGDLAPFSSYVDNIGEGTSTCGNIDVQDDDDDKLSDFDKWYQQSCSSTILASQKSELQSYLDEPVFPRKDDFDILGWWKANSPKFPILSKMARDILAIPATTVASESAFSVGGRVIDETRASLLPDVVEALITTGDWLPLKKKRSKSFMFMFLLLFFLFKSILQVCLVELL